MTETQTVNKYTQLIGFLKAAVANEAQLGHVSQRWLQNWIQERIHDFWAENPTTGDVAPAVSQLTHEKIRDVIRQWTYHWMTKEPGYESRARLCDANMAHHLADLLVKAQGEAIRPATSEGDK
jgi:rubrerythrin